MIELVIKVPYEIARAPSILSAITELLLGQEQDLVAGTSYERFAD